MIFDTEDYRRRVVHQLNPNNRDTDADGFIDGRDPNPCNSPLIPVISPLQGQPIDSDGDGFSDKSEKRANTNPHDNSSHPVAVRFDLDNEQKQDDRIWLEDSDQDGGADTLVLDIDADGLVDSRVKLGVSEAKGDLGGKQEERTDRRWKIDLVLGADSYVQQQKQLTITDLNSDLTIDTVNVSGG